MPSPGFARAFNSALAARQRGELKKARSHFKKALREAPRHSAVLHHLGLLCQQLGDMGEAARYLERAVAADPADPVAFNNLGNVLLERGELEAAVEAYRKSVALKPDYVNALFNLSKLLVRCGRLEEGIGSWRRLLDLAPEDLEARSELGVALMRADRHEEAAAVFRAALAVDPNHAESRNNLGVYLMHKGDLEAAQACFMEALKRDPDNARAYENLARSRRFGPADRGVIARLEKLVGAPSLGDQDRMLCHFTLGKIYDDCGDAGNAFGHYEKGNTLRRRTAKFDAGGHARWVDRVMDAFTPELFSDRQDFGVDSELPVFIIGMIRSGTTLVEQIIASHRAAAGAGEVLYVADIVQALPRHVDGGREYPECVADLTAERARRLGGRYLELLRRKDPRAQRITDKLPTNFLFLGLISLLLPRARVIHCTRDPMDVAVSIYFQRFAEGHEYAYSLEDIAAYYRDYLRLMGHWKRVLPNTIREVKYESLVADQETESRALIEFCGLEWDPACLRFDKSARVVSTASNWQVRQPVYRSSVQKWRRYESFLGPLKSALQWTPTEPAAAGEESP